MTVDHASRAHAHWSASSTARHWQCPGALTLSAGTPRSSSIYAATGTCVHEISERCIRSGQQPADFLDETFKVDGFDIVFDEDCVESATTYVEYARRRIAEAEAEGGSYWLEERFTFDAIKPPFEAGGTGDLVVWFPKQKLLEIVDLKNGRGIVEVTGNKQARSYGLGALLAHPELDAETIMSTIVQPRVHHADGRIRSDRMTITELLDWTTELLAKMRDAKRAEVEYGHVTGGVTMDEWAEKWLRPGNCTFCPAEGFCPALRRKAQEAADIWFEDDKPVIRNQPDLMSPEEGATALDMADTLESWIKAVRSYWHTRAEGGEPPVGYVLVDKRGRGREWGADDAKVIADLKKIVGLTDEEIYTEPKLKSVAQVEKVLGSKRKTEIENMWQPPAVTGTNLVRADKTTRPAAKSVAERYFENDTEN